MSGVCFSTSLRCNPQTCSEETVVFLSGERNTRGSRIRRESRPTSEANSFRHNAVNSAAIHDSQEPPLFEKKFETHIGLLRWQTILPPPLKLQKHTGGHLKISRIPISGVRCIVALCLSTQVWSFCLSGSWVGSVASGLVRPRTRKIGLPADWWSRLDRQ